jgi:hypothetical protein
MVGGQLLQFFDANCEDIPLDELRHDLLLLMSYCATKDIDIENTHRPFEDSDRMVSYLLPTTHSPIVKEFQITIARQLHK